MSPEKESIRNSLKDVSLDGKKLCARKKAKSLANGHRTKNKGLFKDSSNSWTDILLKIPCNSHSGQSSPSSFKHVTRSSVDTSSSSTFQESARK